MVQPFQGCDRRSPYFSDLSCPVIQAQVIRSSRSILARFFVRFLPAPLLIDVAIMSDDATLLRQYATTRSEPAFTGLVERHLDVVYFAALRRCGGDAHSA